VSKISLAQVVASSYFNQPMKLMVTQRALTQRATEQALGADSPRARFVVKLRGRAAQVQRSVLSISGKADDVLE
jgi:hypothetical protein